MRNIIFNLFLKNLIDSFAWKWLHQWILVSIWQNFITHIVLGVTVPIIVFTYYHHALYLWFNFPEGYIESSQSSTEFISPHSNSHLSCTVKLPYYFYYIMKSSFKLLLLSVFYVLINHFEWYNHFSRHN